MNTVIFDTTPSSTRKRATLSISGGNSTSYYKEAAKV